MIKCILALLEDGTIGTVDGRLIIHCKKDMKSFREYTTNTVIVMGRKTIESLPYKLPNRITVCLTRDNNYDHEFCDVVMYDMDSIIEYASAMNKDLVVCGGAEVYNMFMNKIDELNITFYEGISPSDLNVDESNLVKVDMYTDMVQLYNRGHTISVETEFTSDVLINKPESITIHNLIYSKCK